MKITELFKNPGKLESYYSYFIKKRQLIIDNSAKTLVRAHLDKSDHNLRFVKNQTEKFCDWKIVGLYYAVYHACLALVVNKGYISKNHTATLIFILKNYTNIDRYDIEFVDHLKISKKDAEFYLTLKNKRHDASYHTGVLFDKNQVTNLRRESIRLINKIKEIIENKIVQTKNKNIYLIGYRATGKTSVSDKLAKSLDRKVVHLDKELIKRTGRIDEFIKAHGWDAFRKIESELLIKFSKKNDLIVDCGGGIIEKKANIRVLKSTGKVFWLKASAGTIKKRLKIDKSNKKQRPALTEKSFTKEVDEVLKRRIPLYKKAGDYEIGTENKTIKQITDEIIEKIR
ncbi:hypothetical protein GF327_05120 [Candidatus Woesearchaeota archaeon]|nr:hypothetical protein [Candidatus Woesearchaeota archaeon]